jgi:hypothetical protein
MNHEEAEVEVLAPQAAEPETLALLNKSEIDQQITTAKKFPRKTGVFTQLATELATQDAETADECIYALPRDGKTIEGPSARFAEIIAYAWGNCRAGARVIAEDAEFVTAQGSFFDMQQNVHIGYEVRRRITDKKGRRYSSDMIGTTANAACSIALRNAVLKGVPKAIWRKIYMRCRQTVAGDFKTLVARRAEAMKQFQLRGVQPDKVFALLEVKGMDDITLDHLVTLKGVLTAILEGDTTVEQVFAPVAKGDDETQDARLAGKSARNLDQVRSRYSHQQSSQPETAGQQPGELGELGPQAAPLSADEQAKVEKRRQELARQAEQVAEQLKKNGASQQVPATAEAADQNAAPHPSELDNLVSNCFRHGEFKGAECPTCKAEEEAVERSEAQEAVQAQQVHETASQVPAGGEEFDFGNAPRGKNRQRGK